MRPRDSRAHDLHAIAAAVIGSSAASGGVGCADQWELAGGTVCCARHIDGCPATLTAEQLENTYQAGSLVPGIHREDERTHSVVGGNGRRIIVREDADGLYVGGVLIGALDLRVLAGILHDLAERMLRNGHE